MGVLDAVREFIVYTATDAPYRTNPETGKRYSAEQFQMFAQQTSKQYGVSYTTNPYIEPDKKPIAYA